MASLQIEEITLSYGTYSLSKAPLQKKPVFFSFPGELEGCFASFETEINFLLLFSLLPFSPLSLLAGY